MIKRQNPAWNPGWLMAMMLSIQPLAAQQSKEQLSPVSAENKVKEEEGKLRVNFRGVPLEMVLEYLSEAAGFIIMSDIDVKGEVNVWSNKPLTRDEAVELLDSILHEKGYAAIRNGKLLKIVNRDDARKELIPVKSGNDPDAIPKNDSMVTQIIPVRYGDAAKLIEDLEPLIPDYSTLTSNESSNAIVLTDTQSNIHRMVEIIQALDTSISNISSVEVFPLRYSDAKELEEVIKNLFEPQQSSSSRSDRSRSSSRFSIFSRGGDRSGGGSRSSGSNGSQNSEARQAVTRVVAVADERSNSLVVSAAEELMPTITQLIAKLDTNVDDVTEVRVFPLEHSDATEMSELLTNLFSEEQDENNRSSIRFSRGGFSGFGGRGGGGGGRGGNNQESSRLQQQSRVVSVPDPRTNSVIISASRELMSQIGEMIAQLDSSSSKKQKVFVYSLEHADVDNVAEILRGMFESQTSVNGRSNNNRNSNQNNNPLNNRTVGNQTLGRGNTGQGGR